MVIRSPTSGIGMKGWAQIGRGIMPSDHLSSRLRGRHFSQHFFISGDHAGIIHHFPKAYYARPAHRFSNILRRNFKSGGFQPRRRWRARGHLRENIYRLQQRLIMHDPNTRQTQHIGNFMRIGKHRGRAMRDNGRGKFSRDQHAAFDMHMPVAQARNKIATTRIDHLRFWANTMARIRPNIGKPTSDNGNFPTLKNLARLNIDQPTVLNDQIRGRSPGSDSDQICSAICPRCKFTLSHGHLLACSLIAKVWGCLQSVKIFAMPRHVCSGTQNVARLV